MTRDETKLLLAVVMAYDNRKPGDATIAAWAKAAEVGRWTLAEAVTAVHAHYAVETSFLMPGHITQHIRAARQDTAMRQLPPPPVVDPQGQARVRELVAGDLGDLGDAAAHVPQVPDSRRARRCPHCDAAPTRPCTRPSRSGPVPLAGVHPSRLTAAAS